MAKLTVIITENAPTSLRGELTRWMLELKAGIFIGTLSALVREKLWAKISEKIIDGGAFLIHTMNNEQKFEIHSHGKTTRELIDFDGINLIRIPTKKLNKVKKFNKSKSFKDDKTIQNENDEFPINSALDQVSISSGFSHPSQNLFPKDFIWRYLKIKMVNKKLWFDYQGMSSYSEIGCNEIWQDEWKNDLELICRKIFSTIQDIKSKSKLSLNQKFISIDIETTDYIPKAYEGFVNIIGIAELDFKKEKLELIIHQIFNMKRKRDQAFHLLKLLKNEINQADVCIVFNKNFDIKILTKIIKEHDLSISFPKTIIDLNDKFKRLVDLEEDLLDKADFHRNQTQKSKFSEYYKLFKGIGRQGKHKKIEPIGSYNIIDFLSPFLYFFVNI